MKRNWFIAVFLVFWLGGWGIGWKETAKQLAKNPAQPFLLFWIAGWTIGGIWALTWCLRMLAGRDIVTLRQDFLEVRKQVFAMGWTKQYLRSQIRDLRFQPEIQQRRAQRVSRIAFDYGAKTITFADGLDEAEANQILAKILERFEITETPKGVSTPKFWQSRSHLAHVKIDLLHGSHSAQENRDMFDKWHPRGQRCIGRGAIHDQYGYCRRFLHGSAGRGLGQGWL